MAADILVINAGSSSIKAGLYRAAGGDPAEVIRAQVEGIGTSHPRASTRGAAGGVVLDEPLTGGVRTHDDATTLVVARLTRNRPGWAPAGIGHRVVHGGTRYSAPVRIDDAVRADLEALVPLAPLHQPANLTGIDAAGRAFPGVPQVACFDTAFHRGRAFAAEAFALPRQYFDDGVRRYGFHGLSYESVARALRTIAPDVAAGRVVVCHLGNGASLCGMRGGASVETTMGFTALDGLPMGTRCGQLDPGVILYLLDREKMTHAGLTDLLYKQSGLLGLSEIGSDMRDLLAADDAQARDAVDYFVYRVTCHVGAVAAGLGGIDGLVFTAGIGENSAAIRGRVCRALGWLGLDLDPAANAAHGPRISAAGSRVSAWVVPTDEDRTIATHVAGVLGL